MSAYAAALVSALIVTSVLGHPCLAATVSLGGLLYATTFHVFVYARRRQRKPLKHRLREDRRVAVQWVSVAVIGSAAAAACLLVPELTVTQREVMFFGIGATIFFGAVYGSALVDWYYIHPRLAGLIGPAPCETACNGGWVGLTNIGTSPTRRHRCCFGRARCRSCSPRLDRRFRYRTRGMDPAVDRRSDDRARN